MKFSLASALINSFPLDQVGVCWSLLVLTLLTHHYHSLSEFRPVFVFRLTTLLYPVVIHRINLWKYRFVKINS